MGYVSVQKRSVRFGEFLSFRKPTHFLSIKYLYYWNWNELYIMDIEHSYSWHWLLYDWVKIGWLKNDISDYLTALLIYHQPRGRLLKVYSISDVVSSRIKWEISLMNILFFHSHFEISHGNRLMMLGFFYTGMLVPGYLLVWCAHFSFAGETHVLHLKILTSFVFCLS